MRKKLLGIITICLIMFLLLSVTNTAYATTSENITETNTYDYYIEINPQTQEITKIPKDEVTATAEAAKERNKGILVNKYQTKGYKVNLPTTSTTVEMLSPRSVIGGDGRIQAQTDLAICEIVSTFPNGEFSRGTGFTIYKDMLLTAGHCIYRHDKGGLATKITITPGATGSNIFANVGNYNAPIGTFDFSTIKGIIVDPGYLNNQDAAEDYALVTFHQNLGAGWFGIATRDSGWSEMVNQIMTVQGYDNNTNKVPWVQWKSTGLLTNINNRNFSHLADTGGGTSGAPVCHQSRLGIGIHVAGTSNTIFNGSNLATLINRQRFNLFYKYITESPLYTG